jgi:hypothetical protein
MQMRSISFGAPSFFNEALLPKLRDITSLSFHFTLMSNTFDILAIPAHHIHSFDS